MTQKHFIASMLLITTASLGLSSCGFQPVYGNVDAMNGPIKVMQIDGRIGHRLRQELTRTLSSGLPGIEDGAFLTVTAVEGLQRLNLKANVGVSRTTIIGTANYTLRDIEGRVLLSGSVSVQTDYDVANSEYGDIALQTDARERVAYLLSRRLQEQLSLDATSSRQDIQMKEAESTLTETAEEDDAAKSLEDNQDKLDRIP